jgi:hypothetical protein
MQDNRTYLHESARLAMYDVINPHPVDKFTNRAILQTYRKYKEEDFLSFDKMPKKDCELQFAKDILKEFENVEFKHSEIDQYVAAKQSIINAWGV